MNLRRNIFFISHDKIQKIFNSKFLSSNFFKNVFLIKTFPNFSCSFIRTVNVKQCITTCAENDVSTDFVCLFSILQVFFFLWFRISYSKRMISNIKCRHNFFLSSFIVSSIKWFNPKDVLVAATIAVSISTLKIVGK